MEYIIDISPDGLNVKVEVKGGTGSECVKQTESIEQGFGKVVKRVLKSEYHKEIEVEQVVKVGK